MLVKAVAHIRNEDVRLALNKPECAPGDLLDLPDGIAQVYLAEGWVLPVRKDEISAQRMANPAIETAMMSGAPETAARTRARARNKGNQPQE